VNPGTQHPRSPGEPPRIEEPEFDGDERPRSSRDSRDSRDFTEDEVDSDKILGPILGW
jgi:hypothetical protein